MESKTCKNCLCSTCVHNDDHDMDCPYAGVESLCEVCYEWEVIEQGGYVPCAPTEHRKMCNDYTKF